MECHLTWETPLVTEKVNVYIFPKLLTFLIASKIYKRLQLQLSNSLQRKTFFPGSLPKVFLVWKYVSCYNLSKKKIHSFVLRTFLLWVTAFLHLSCQKTFPQSSTERRTKAWGISREIDFLFRKNWDCNKNKKTQEVQFSQTVRKCLAE